MREGVGRTREEAAKILTLPFPLPSEADMGKQGLAIYAAFHGAGWDGVRL